MEVTSNKVMKASEIQSTRQGDKRQTENYADKETQTEPKPETLIKRPKMQFYKRELPDKCIAFSSVDGKRLFREAMLSGNADVYFSLAEQFCTQAEPAYCGLTTLVMVLNTLAVDPKRIWRGGWRWYHEEMLDCCLSLDVVQQKGITMDQFVCLAACNSLDLNVVRMSENESIDDFREIVKRICSGSGKILVCSYSRREFGQTGDGHFSPIGAYHEKEDLLLIFDVARFKYPPHWVKVELMWEAMKYCDTTTEKPRGYIVMRKTEEMPLILFRLSSTFRVTIATRDVMESCMARFLNSWKVYLKNAATCEFDCESNFDNALKCLLEALNEALASLIDGESVFTTQFDPCCADSLSEDHLEKVHQLLRALESTDVYKSTQQWIIEFKKAIDPTRCKEGNKRGCKKRNCCRIERVGKAINDIEEMGNEFQKDIGSEGNEKMKCLTSNWSQGKSPCTSEKCKKKIIKKEFLSETHYLTMFLLCWPYHMEGESIHITALSRYVRDTLQNSDVILQNEVALLQKQIESLSLMVSCHDKA